MFGDAGRAQQYTVRWSESAGTLSVMLDCDGITRSTWSVEGDEVVQVHDERTEVRVDVECGADGSALRMNGYQEWRRVDGAMAELLRSMGERSDCQGLAYPP